MMRKNRLLAALRIALFVILIFLLPSCDSGLAIVSVDVIQLPYKVVYVAGTADNLDMEGCIIRLYTRDGRETDILFDSWPFITVRYEIDFATTGEYQVFFYWGDVQIYTMTIQVIYTNRPQTCNMILKEHWPNFTEQTLNDNIDSVSLIIYYMDPRILTRVPVSLDSLINGLYDYRIIVASEDLAKHRDLLNQLTSTEFVPVKSESVIDARLYYVFEHAEYGEIFNFLSSVRFGDNISVNGHKTESNRVFFEMVVPFLTESAVEMIEVYLSNKH